MRTIRLLAKFDPFVHNLLNDSKKNVKYLSWKIQDELIEILASEVRNSICDEIKKCSWFSIILDSTKDITNIDQVSVIIRYVFVEYENHTLDIRESFSGFFALQNHDSSDYAELSLKILTKFGLDIKKCRGQGYDGASVMSGAHFGGQKQIINIVPTALYVHCCAHNLNLVISDAAKTSQKIFSFFSIVQDDFNLFGYLFYIFNLFKQYSVYKRGS